MKNQWHTRLRVEYHFLFFITTYGTDARQHVIFFFNLSLGQVARYWRRMNHLSLLRVSDRFLGIRGLPYFKVDISKQNLGKIQV